jgi:ribosomal protein L33
MEKKLKKLDYQQINYKSMKSKNKSTNKIDLKKF